MRVVLQIACLLLGSVLGPLLFLLFKTNYQKMRLFADDCIVYRPIYDHSDSAVLQQDLDAFAEWESKWGMEFHPQKCSVLRVSRSRSLISHPFKLKGHILITENTTKYMGIDLQTTLSWKTHIDRISKRANSMLVSLDATSGLVVRTPKPTSTSTRSVQTWNTARLFGTRTRRIRYRN